MGILAAATRARAPVSPHMALEPDPRRVLVREHVHEPLQANALAMIAAPVPASALPWRIPSFRFAIMIPRLPILSTQVYNSRNFPHKIREPLSELLPPDTILQTAKYRDWTNILNGDLLPLARAHRFTHLLTLDKGFLHEHRHPYPLAILLVKTKHMKQLLHNKTVRRIATALQFIQTRQLHLLDVDTPPQRPRRRSSPADNPPRTVSS